MEGWIGYGLCVLVGILVGGAGVFLFARWIFGGPGSGPIGRGLGR